MPLVEKRYAQAMIAMAEKNNALDLYQQELETVAGIYENQQDISLFLKNPETGIEIRKSVLKKAFSGIISNEVLNLLLLLMDKSRIEFLPGIRSEYAKFADEKRSTLNIKIISAVPLDQSRVDGIAEKYRKLYGASSVNKSVEIDPGVIGGVKVVIGDKLIDGTVKGKLNELYDILVK